MFRNIILLFGALSGYSECFDIVNPGFKYPPTKGEVWPKPQHELKTEKFYTFNPSNFKFDVLSHTCTLLTDALERYVYLQLQHYTIIRRSRRRSNGKRHRKLLCSPSDNVEQDDNYEGGLLKLEIALTRPCEDYPHLDMDETYNLTISTNSQLMSSSIWGIIRGLETFSQLLYFTDDYNEVRINTTHIEDFPRYAHRGLLLDTSRHYISTRNILLTLDAMAYNKMNVFHWHIVDDQSFPYQSVKFPELSARGAFHPSAVYTKSDVEKVINYARDRGIRVIPEFDVPGHTRSWGVAYPNILTECYEGHDVVGLGPMDPINNATYKLIRDLFKEVNALFPDKYFHIGGDEVDLRCWSSNPVIQDYMLNHNLTTVNELHALFMRNALPLLDTRMKTIVWQEVFDENVPLSKDTLIHVWKSGYLSEMLKILKAGHQVLFSSEWYLDQKETLGTWQTLYKADPRQMINNSKLEAGIIGGEACMWGEMVDDRNLISRVWPRASAAAERLWSSPGGVLMEAVHRIEEHTCRLIQRGINAQPPNGPSFCLV